MTLISNNISIKLPLGTENEVQIEQKKKNKNKSNVSWAALNFGSQTLFTNI